MASIKLYVDGIQPMFRLSETDKGHPILDISENDVLSIIEAILDDPTCIEIETLDINKEKMNPAASEVYSELKSQFEKLVSKRDQVIAKLDSHFTDAEEYYRDEALKMDLLD